MESASIHLYDTFSRWNYPTDLMSNFLRIDIQQHCVMNIFIV